MRIPSSQTLSTLVTLICEINIHPLSLDSLKPDFICTHLYLTIAAFKNVKKLLIANRTPVSLLSH